MIHRPGDQPAAAGPGDGPGATISRGSQGGSSAGGQSTGAAMDASASHRPAPPPPPPTPPTNASPGPRAPRGSGGGCGWGRRRRSVRGSPQAGQEAERSLPTAFCPVIATSAAPIPTRRSPPSAKSLKRSLIDRPHRTSSKSPPRSDPTRRNDRAEPPRLCASVQRDRGSIGQTTRRLRPAPLVAEEPPSLGGRKADPQPAANRRARQWTRLRAIDPPRPP